MPSATGAPSTPFSQLLSNRPPARKDVFAPIIFFSPLYFSNCPPSPLWENLQILPEFCFTSLFSPLRAYPNPLLLSCASSLPFFPLNSKFTMSFSFPCPPDFAGAQVFSFPSPQLQVASSHFPFFSPLLPAPHPFQFTSPSLFN